LFSSCGKDAVPDLPQVPGPEGIARSGGGDGDRDAGGGEATSCNCEYEVVSITIDNPPTSGTGDHAELNFFAIPFCDPASSLNIRYFSGYFGDCAKSDFLSTSNIHGTSSSNGFVPFFCTIPGFDIYDIDMGSVWWYPGDCSLLGPQVFSGEITFRIRCADNAPSNCTFGQSYISNTKTVTFNQSGFTNGMTPTVHMGATSFGPGGEVLIEGCGCEVLITD